jgi:hypothetical protein
MIAGRAAEGGPMPLFMIERNFAEQLQMTAQGRAAVKQVNEDVGVSWLFSFLSADKKKPSACTRRRAPRPSARQHGGPTSPPTP